jgi:hypothetical protein
VACVSLKEGQTAPTADLGKKSPLAVLRESSSTLPSRSIRADVNLVGLLARVSSDRSCLPSASLHQWLARFAPPRLQWRGRSGFTPDSHATPSPWNYTAPKRRGQVGLTTGIRRGCCDLLACAKMASGGPNLFVRSASVRSSDSVRATARLRRCSSLYACGNRPPDRGRSFQD